PDGSPVRRIVYNVYDVDTEIDGYVVVHRSKWGEFFVERPNPSLTTTPDPTEPGDTQESGCDGRCKWSWNAADNVWELDSNGCAPVTTTTSTTTTTTTTTSTTSEPTTTTTTTTEGCLCPTTTTPEGSTTTTT